MTSGVDLKLRDTTPAVIRGEVTDRTTGAPVAAVAVLAIGVGQHMDSLTIDEMFHADSGARTVTLPDGTYTIRLGDLNTSGQYAIVSTYFTEGGSAWQPNTDVLTTLVLEPGANEEFDFQVDAPVTVPVRYIDPSGAPVEGVLAAMRQEGAGGGCGGALISDAEGRVEFHGIPPFVSLEALAWRDTGHGLLVLGASTPFQGTPGERVSEVIVECRQAGGVEGVAVDASGKQVAIGTLGILAGRLAAGNRAIRCTTDESGYFILPEVIVEDDYPVVYVLRELEDGIEAAAVPDVRIEGGMITNLGTVTLQTYTREEAAQLMQ